MLHPLAEGKKLLLPSIWFQDLADFKIGVLELSHAPGSDVEEESGPKRPI
jgi:hypothetical protein